jgi:hypothetical protein
MDWNFQRGAWKDSKPIGKQAENFIMENTQWVLYFRRDYNFKCPNHWDLAAGSPRFLGVECDTCWGFGIKTTPQIVPSRLSFGPGGVSHRETDTKGEGGYAEYFTTIAHFPRVVKPQNEDVVCVCEWNKHSQKLGGYPRPRVLKLTACYQIKTINDYFERELAYYSCGLEIYDIQMKALSDSIKNLVNLPIVQPTQSWPQNSFW